LLAVGTLATATYSLIGMSHATSTTISSWTSGAACVVFGISFIAVEARHESPMLPLLLLRRRTLGPVALVGLLHNVSIYGLIFVCLQSEHGSGRCFCEIMDPSVP